MYSQSSVVKEFENVLNFTQLNFVQMMIIITFLIGYTWFTFFSRLFDKMIFVSICDYSYNNKLCFSVDIRIKCYWT